MQWDDPVQYPGAVAVAHPNGASRVQELVIATDHPEDIREWIKAPDVPVTLVAGSCDLQSVTIDAGANASITLPG